MGGLDAEDEGLTLSSVYFMHPPSEGPKLLQKHGFEGNAKIIQGTQFILCIIDKVTNYLITVAIHQSKSEKIGDALTENVI